MTCIALSSAKSKRSSFLSTILSELRANVDDGEAVTLDGSREIDAVKDAGEGPTDGADDADGFGETEGENEGPFDSVGLELIVGSVVGVCESDGNLVFVGAREGTMLAGDAAVGVAVVLGFAVVLGPSLGKDVNPALGSPVRVGFGLADGAPDGTPDPFTVGALLVVSRVLGREVTVGRPVRDGVTTGVGAIDEGRLVTVGRPVREGVAAGVASAVGAIDEGRLVEVGATVTDKLLLGAGLMELDVGPIVND